MKCFLAMIITLLVSLSSVKFAQAASYCGGGGEICCTTDCRNRCNGTGNLCTRSQDCAGLPCIRPSPCQQECHVWNPCPLNTALGPFACNNDVIDCVGPNGFQVFGSCRWITVPDFCGDGICNNGETCSSCSRDCYCPPGGGGGTNPPPPPPADTCARCETGISNCGERGLDPADGTCGAGLCCKDKSSWTGCIPNYDVPPGCARIGEAIGHCENGGFPCASDSSCSDSRCLGMRSCCSGLVQDGYFCQCPAAVCQPTCPAGGPFCGSPNGCGGNCPSTDAGAPAVPAFTTPSASNEMLRTDGETNLTLSWSSVAKAERYELEIYASDTPFTAPAQGNLIVSSAPLIATSFTFTPNNRYFGARLRALNSTCSAEYSPWSGYAYFQAAVPVNGNVYYDMSGQASLTGSLCTGPTDAVPAELGALYVSGTNNVPAYGSYPDVAIANPAAHAQPGAYSLRLPFSPVGSTGTNLVMFSLPSPELGCSCPSGCTYTGLNAPLGNVNFFVSPSSDPWFQVEGGPIAAFARAGQTALNNSISEFCAPPACNPFLIVNQNGQGSEGYVLTGGGSVASTSDIDESGHNWIARMTSAPERRQDYQYFKILSLLPTNPDSDFDPGLIASLDKPDKDQNFVNGDQARAYFHAGEAVIDSSWNIEADQKIVLLIDGDISIEEPITVETGGFFMLVASGNITFDSSLGHDDVNNPDAVAEGIYVADGLIIVESTDTGGDKRFIGEGTFVGWSGVDLQRDYDDGAGRRALNNVSAIEYFRYRPDFITAAPEEFMRSRYSWQQVNP